MGIATVCCPTIDRELVSPVTYCSGGANFTRTDVYDVTQAAPVFLSSIWRDSSGAVVTAPTAPVLGSCAAVATSASTNIGLTCDAFASAKQAYGGELLVNGDMELGVGTGGSTVPGPGWTTGYVPAADIFAAGASTLAYFTTNAGSVTGGNPSAAMFQALGKKSLAVNVGPNTSLAVIEWNNIYLENGKSYSLATTMGVIVPVASLSVAIDGANAFPITTPAITGVWQNTATDFTFAGVTGYHRVGIQSNSGIVAGNDIVLDNISLREIFPAKVAGPLTPVTYTSTVRSVVDQVVQTKGCNDDTSNSILTQIARNTAPVSGVWTSAQPPVTRTSATSAGSTVANSASVTFVNVGTTAGTVAGVALLPRETVTVNAYEDPVTRTFNRVPSIPYVGSATAIIDITTQA